MSSAVLHPRASAVVRDVSARRALPTAEVDARREFAADVARDLGASPKRLQPKYLYDALGSQLFEAICALPWYRITRAERRLLALHADAMTAPLGEVASVIELGCGSGEKMAVLLAGIRRHARPLRVHLIDISPTALAQSARTLGALPLVSVVTHRAGYEAGLRQVAAARLRTGATLALFLGSNIGNFDPAEANAFLRRIHAALRPGDGVLVGADLVKPTTTLLQAYDDPLGVTAAFNRNLLVRINRDLGGEFDLDDFAHEARWNASESRVEMHLVCRRAVTVPIAGAGIEASFAAGETIWTESSYKYVPSSIRACGEAAGLCCHEQWIDGDAAFGVTLFIVPG